MVIKLHRLCSLLLILVALQALPAWAISKLTATVDRNPVMERESFVLEIVADDSVNSDELDLSPLDGTGFVVGRTASSSQTQIINGTVSKTTSWSIVLVARKAGKFKIPVFELEGVKSQPLSVEVIKSSAKSGQTNQPIFLKNNIEQTSLYLQQSVKLISRLYFSPQVELQSGSLSDPSLDGAIVQQQGKDKETSEIVMGVRYRVIERIYTITPQTSGDFIIQSPTFNGEVASGNRRRSMFSAFTQSKPVSAFGDDIEIKVLSIPEDYVGSWLPSEIVQLNEEWQPDKTEFEVGEAITRTFTLTALNVSEAQLPEVTGQYPAEFKVYPDQSEAHSVLRQNALVSQRISSEAIVANKPGQFELPEVTLSWFNTKTGRQEIARVPARTVTIAAASSNNALAGTTLVPQSQETGQVQACPAECEQTATAPENLQITTVSNQWLTSLGWILWLLTLILWYLTRRPSHQGPVPVKGKRQFDLSRLKGACLQNDPTATRAQLILWGQDKYGEITNLAQLEAKVPAPIQQELRRLNLAQYSKSPRDWQGENLWKLLKGLEKQSEKPSHTEPQLAPLNG